MKIFTTNRKTILSVDFSRKATCKTICHYCYVDQLERIYPAYKNKLDSNSILALNSPAEFANKLNSEYSKALNSKSKAMHRIDKLPVRIYGSGDYITSHFKFLSKLDFKYYIISKNLTSNAYKKEINKLLKLHNLTKIVLSFDKDNIHNYDNLKHFYGKDRIAFSYTGTPEEFNTIRNNYKFNIYFNTQKNKKNIMLARAFKEQCPCDTKLLKSEKACSYCNKCWKSSITKH